MRFDEPPMYLEKGSLGSIVDKLLAFLDRWAKKEDKGETGIVLDGEFGDTGVRWLKEYQKVRGLEPDGGCGPETRKTMLTKDGFDFVKAAALCEDISEYVQSDGTTLYWAIGIMATPNKEEAMYRFYKSRHGN